VGRGALCDSPEIGGERFGNRASGDAHSVRAELP
jgi:hypothetical protein